MSLSAAPGAVSGCPRSGIDKADISLRYFKGPCLGTLSSTIYNYNVGPVELQKQRGLAPVTTDRPASVGPSRSLVVCMKVGTAPAIH